MDGRRHSVDIPISKTLVALRRVRSLRDPSTNSSNRLSAFVENLNWETNSTNGITLGFVNDSIDNDDAIGSKDVGLYGQIGEHASDCEMYYSSRKQSSNLVAHEYSDLVGVGSGRSIRLAGSNVCRTNQEVGPEIKSLSERYYSEYREKGVGLTSRTPPGDSLEGVGSCNGNFEGLMQEERVGQNASKRKSRQRRHIRSSRAAAGDDILSRVGSPCLSTGDVPVENSSRSMSLYENEDVEVVYPNSHGCGISRCWSRTPRFRESNFPSNVEEKPLLSEEVGMLRQFEQRKAWKNIGNEVILFSESPRSFSQKFRPKSFGELVGQNFVARSLLSAIANERITPFYLFHGPRGTGKTSASRIFAAALNCVSYEESRPCGLCQECVSFFSGRNRDVKEVDSVRINRVEKVRWIIKSAAIPPISSRYKIFIIDECHLLRGTTWATILNGFEEFSRHVVFIMITPDLDKLPRSAVSRSQRYHFPKIKEVDAVFKLKKICIEEGLKYDQNALGFIATKSSGSLRDAEMMLEQLSLLSKRITISLAYELIGIVSDEELLDLLDLALSSDTANTVRRARELMKSRIDPMHLISQLANIIMDILSGKCLDGASEVKKKFLERHSSEADLQQLTNALKILSETEKQLRTSKNQTTWLTVALLQLNSTNSLLDTNETRLCTGTGHPRDGDCCSTSHSNESLKHLVTHACDTGKGTLESLWSRATEICESNALRNFLQKKGKLASVYFNEGLAVAELEFCNPSYVIKAEKSWKLIAGALQSTLGCNVEIRITLIRCDPEIKSTKVKKPIFSLFGCSRRMQHESQSPTDLPENFTPLTERPMMKGKIVQPCSSDCGSQNSRICCNTQEAARTIRNNDGNALTVGTITSNWLLPDNNIPEQPDTGVDSSKEMENNCRCQDLSADAAEEQPSCFSRTMKLRKKLHSSDTSQITLFHMEPQKNLALATPSRISSETYFCAGDPYILCSKCKRYTKCRGDEDSRGRKDSKLHCWRTPTFPFKKAWRLRHHQPQRSHLVDWVLPCAKAS